jgi:hypothetical protein
MKGRGGWCRKHDISRRRVVSHLHDELVKVVSSGVILIISASAERVTGILEGNAC